MLTFLLQTLGCKSNQYESQAMREALAAAGWREAADPASADLFLINTCGVTGRAGASCRNAIRRAVKANPALRVAITGCGVDLGERWPDIPSGPPLLVPNADKAALPLLIRDWLSGLDPAAPVGGDAFGLSVSGFHGHTRAFLKIQDGCDNFCSYCAVPRARGLPRSRDPRDVLAEAARLTGAGYGELVLTGINIGAYSHGALDFAALVAELAATPGLVRLRLGSVEPPQVTERLAAVMRAHDRICPHLHLPLQSGSDRVLAAMNRRYDAAAFLDKAAMLREALPLPALTTDVIVGFPGEDEAAFRESAETCRRAGFSRLHVFLFSPRPGTPAASMRRTVPDRIVEEWKSGLIALGNELAASYAAACVGLRERVIVEEETPVPAGLSDRYLRTRLPGCRATAGDTVAAAVSASEGPALVAACAKTA